MKKGLFVAAALGFGQAEQVPGVGDIAVLLNELAADLRSGVRGAGAQLTARLIDASAIIK